MPAKIIFEVKNRKSFIQENPTEPHETGWEGGLSYKIEKKIEKNRQFQER